MVNFSSLDAFQIYLLLHKSSMLAGFRHQKGVLFQDETEIQCQVCESLTKDPHLRDNHCQSSSLVLLRVLLPSHRRSIRTLYPPNDLYWDLLCKTYDTFIHNNVNNDRMSMIEISSRIRIAVPCDNEYVYNGTWQCSMPV